MSAYRVAVVGATGVVGQELLKVLHGRNFPVKSLKLLASARSAGTKLTFKDEEIVVEETTEQSFSGVQIAFFASSDAASDIFGWKAVERGAVVIDNSNYFRMDDRVPLVIPEINKEALRHHKGMIANPNCTATILVMALKPIHDAAGIKRIAVTTFQSVSGWGREAMDELRTQTAKALENEKPEHNPNIFAHPIAFNVIPQCDRFLEDGITGEEQKVALETRKILGDPDILVNATCARVPVFVGHSEAVNVATKKKLALAQAQEILSGARGVVLAKQKNEYTVALDAAGKDEVFVGRLREDPTVENGLSFWVVGDNLRKGAATNSVQIAEALAEMGLIS